MSPNELWRFLPLGYLLTILIETPILLIGLSSRHPFGRKLFAGVWLTACTYPIVILVLPLLFAPYHRFLYLLFVILKRLFAQCVTFPAKSLRRSSSRQSSVSLPSKSAASPVRNVAAYSPSPVTSSRAPISETTTGSVVSIASTTAMPSDSLTD